MTTRLVEGVTHVQVPVHELARAVTWYCTQLGCEVVEVYPNMAILRLPVGPTFFLWQTEDHTSATFTVNGEPFPTIGIETKAIDQLAVQLQVAGVDVRHLPGGGTGRRFLKFFDLDGNMFVAHQEPSSVEPSPQPTLSAR